MGAEQMVGHFEMMPGARQIISVKIHKVQTSCGFSIPFMNYSGERDTLIRSNLKKDEAEQENYLCENNSSTIDGTLTPLGKMLLNGSRSNF
jgi:hypothetical protein